MLFDRNIRFHASPGLQSQDMKVYGLLPPPFLSLVPVLYTPLPLHPR